MQISSALHRRADRRGWRTTQRHGLRTAALLCGERERSAALRGRAVPGERRAGHCAPSRGRAGGRTEQSAKAVQTQTAPLFPGVGAAPVRPCHPRAMPRRRPGREMLRADLRWRAGRRPPFLRPTAPGAARREPDPPPPRERGSSSRPTHRRGRAAGANGAGAHFHTVRPGPARPGPAALSGPGGAVAWRQLSALRARLERGGRNEPQPRRRRMEP